MFYKKEMQSAFQDYLQGRGIVSIDAHGTVDDPKTCVLTLDSGARVTWQALESGADFDSITELDIHDADGQRLYRGNHFYEYAEYSLESAPELTGQQVTRAPMQEAVGRTITDAYEYDNVVVFSLDNGMQLQSRVETMHSKAYLVDASGRAIGRCVIYVHPSPMIGIPEDERSC
jgi:hypothetical protein